MTRRLCLALSLILLACPAFGEELTLVAFNVESGGADPDVIADQLTMLTDTMHAGVEVFVLSEVQQFSWGTIFDQELEDHTGREHGFWLSNSGGGDRLLVLFDKTRLKMIEQVELDHINIGGGVRSPLAVTFESRATGERFQVVANHFYRSRSDRRRQQARLLNEWVRDDTTLPVVTAGDFNFDWDVQNGDQDHDEAYDNLTQDDRWLWVRPTTLVATNCSNVFDSVLDFVFTGNAAQNWTATSEILFPEDDYCPDSNDTSDHRPVLAQFDTGGEPIDETNMLKQQLLQRIQALEDELRVLRELVEGIE